MPIYEFRCKNCGHEKEELVSTGTDSIACSKCNKLMNKLISLSSFHLVGSGWANDNYGLKQSKNKK